jgi:hypothetical protein
MFPPADPRGADRSMLAYVVALTAIFALFAFGLFWLEQPYALPNPGLAAYKPPAGLSVPLTTSAETMVAMERSARLAAGETKVTQTQADNKAGEEKPPRVVRNYVVRRPSRVASRPPGFEAQRPSYPSSYPWGYAQNRGFGSWF